VPDVRLVDLEIFKRFSLALRQEHADAAEVLAVLEDSAESIRREMAPARRRKAPAKKKPAARKTTPKITGRKSR
jgi:hypothetical protein